MMRESKAGAGRADTALPIGKNGYTLGLSHRAWVIVAFGFGLFTFTKFILPSSSSEISTAGHYTSSPHLLTPRDYLNASASDPAPFDFCPVFGPGDPVAERRGQHALLKSRLHTGSGARVQRVLQKALSGEPVTISVLGGSVSACHGAGDDPLSSKCYPSRFFEWWNQVFPHPASELTNGAARKTDSAYFAYCAMHHLPDKTDLVILEFDAADPNEPEWLSHFELLVRSILVRPDQPAVIILGHFSPQVQAQNGFAGPELLHSLVAQFYDVPHISAKGVLYNDYMANPVETRKAFYTDAVLANPAGHDLIADVLISYMMSQICAGWSATMGHAFDVPFMGLESTAPGDAQLLGGVGIRPAMGIPGQEDAATGESAIGGKAGMTKVPNARLEDRPSNILNFREIEPFCASANDLISPLPPSLFYGSGWAVNSPKKGTDERHYWYAEVPESRLRVPIRISHGNVAIYYIQQPSEKALGRVACWVDDNVAGGRELTGTADVPDVTPTLTIIDQNVSPGSHFVECMLQGEPGTMSPPFKILGIFAT